jgi:hypothetical protein
MYLVLEFVFTVVQTDRNGGRRKRRREQEKEEEYNYHDFNKS